MSRRDDRSGLRNDLDEAVTAGSGRERIRPRSVCACNDAGNLLRRRYQVTLDETDIAKALSLLDPAVRLNDT